MDKWERQAVLDRKHDRGVPDFALIVSEIRPLCKSYDLVVECGARRIPKGQSLNDFAQIHRGGNAVIERMFADRENQADPREHSRIAIFSIEQHFGWWW